MRAWVLLTTMTAVLGLTTSAPAQAAQPGDVIRFEPITASQIGVPTNAWRILYTSTSATGTVTEVSGALLVPRASFPGNRPIIGYAPGTHGMGDQCAPSRNLAAGSETEAPLMSTMLEQGWAVVVTDYEGLGTPGDHTYMVGRSQGRATLDALRAATRVPAAGLSAAAPMAVFGYSQGGASAGWAAQLAPGYAPELPIKGVAAGGTPADLNQVALHLDGKVDFGYVPMTAVGFKTAYPELPLETHLNAAGRAVFADIRDDCASEANGKLSGKRMADYSTTNMLALPSWQARLTENRLGGMTPRVPVLLYHGLFDSTIPMGQASTLRRQYCARGVAVRWNVYPGDHVGAAIIGAIPVRIWLGDRLAGRPDAGNC